MSKKILLVDDDRENIELMTQCLEPEGYTIITASNGEEALRKIEAENPDGMVLDIVMPKLNGFEVLRELKFGKKPRTLPIIVLTIKGETDAIFETQGLGASEYITKPVDSVELVKSIQKYVF